MRGWKGIFMKSVGICLLILILDTAVLEIWYFHLREFCHNRDMYYGVERKTINETPVCIVLFTAEEIHHGCKPSLVSTRPTSLSRCPSKTLRTNGPAVAGSPAPILLNNSWLPPSPVARKPGEMQNTFTASSLRMRYHSRREII